MQYRISKFLRQILSKEIFGFLRDSGSPAEELYLEIRIS